MDKFQNFLEYLLEHPSAVRLLGIILIAILSSPYIILWARMNQVRRIRKAYDDLITDQTTTITKLYRNIMEIQGHLAKTRGELDQKIAELKNHDINLSKALADIVELRDIVRNLEQQQLELIEKLKTYEKLPK